MRPGSWQGFHDEMEPTGGDLSDGSAGGGQGKNACVSRLCKHAMKTSRRGAERAAPKDWAAGRLEIPAAGLWIQSLLKAD